MKSTHVSLVVLVAIVLALPLACSRKEEGRRVDTPASSSTSSSNPHGGAAMSREPGGALPNPHAGMGSPVDPATLPMKETGSGSMAELERGQKATASAEAAGAFATGFRLTFTTDQGKRDYATARDLFQRAIALDAKYAEAYRGLAYAEFNLGFNRDAAMTNYQKALELKPDYGEVHYALSFMYAMDDRTKGAEHFKKAMELGVPDERNLAERFYPEIKIPTH